MMVKALATCLPVVFDMEDEARVRAAEIDPDYDPNPNGYFSTNRLPHDHIGGLMKCHLVNWPMVKPGPYKIIWMQRDEEERQRSMQRAFGDDSNLSRLYDIGEQLLALTDAVKIDYQNVVESPLAVFEALKAYGWPIDPEICAKEIDPSLWRNR